MSTDDKDRVHMQQRLEAEGITCRDIYTLGKDPRALTCAAPLLLSLLPEIDSFRVKAEIVRVVSNTRISPKLLVDELKRVRFALKDDVKPSRPIARLSGADLVAELKRIRSQSTGAANLAWALAEALGEWADESVFDDIVALIRDKGLGRARQMLPYALVKIKSRRREAIQVLLDTLGDEEITAHSLDALGRMKAAETLPAIRPYLESSHRLVRTEAKRAIQKIEKAASGKTEFPDRASNSPPPIREALAEASMNFDLENVPPFLRRVASLVEGFGQAEIEQVEGVLLEMEPDGETGFDFAVRYGGHETPLQIRVFMDDADAPDVAFFTSPQLAEAIDRLMDEME